MLMKLGLSRSTAEDRMGIFLTKLKQQGFMKGGDERKGVDGIGDSVVDALSTSESAAVFMSKLPQFVFILKSIEQNSPGGELIGLVMDVFTTTLSTATDSAQLLIANIPGFGPAINFVIGLFVWPFLAMISLSRKEFEQSIEEYLKVIPLGIGKAMSIIFAKTDKLGVKVESRWDKISEQFAILIENAKQAMDKTQKQAPPSPVNRPIGGRRKRLSTKKQDKKNKKWRRTRRIKSVRR
jgi:hypothetical protein